MFDPSNEHCLGCIYLSPARKAGYEIEVFYWVRASEVANGLDHGLGAFVKQWVLEAWPFESCIQVETLIGTVTRHCPTGRTGSRVQRRCAVVSSKTSDVQPTDYLELDDSAKAQVVAFTAVWVTGDDAGAHGHFADHEGGDGSTLVAFVDDAVAGLITLRWKSTNPEFAAKNIPIVHQLSVASDYQRRGLGNSLMQDAERLATDKLKDQ